MHKRINFDRFATVKMYQVYREGNFVERKEISKCWEGNYFFQSGNTAHQVRIFVILHLRAYNFIIS